jgi:acetyl-CoA C-acetyltransferase
MYVKSAAMTTFEISKKSAHELAYEAVVETLQKAEMKIKEVDAIVCGYIDFSKTGERNRHFSAMMSSMLKTDVPVICTPTACCSGGVALFTANKLPYDNVLVVGAEKLTSTSNSAITDEIVMGADMVWEQQEGLIFPAQNALLAQQHMMKFGTKQEDLGRIAVKNHKNANMNSKAKFYNKKVLISDYNKSPVIASPLKLLDCSVNVDGAAACLLTKDKTDIEIVGSGFATDKLAMFERDELTNFGATRKAASIAYSEAGINAADVDIAELHDAFTIVELVSYEDLGFCKQGAGGEFIRSGVADISGKMPINTSGGLKAKGHPLSATGVAQVVEVVEQMRNEAGDRNVSNFSDNKLKYGLVQNIGGAGGSVTVHVLRKNNGK